MSKISFNISGIHQIEFTFKDPFIVIPGFREGYKIDAGITINYRWNIEKDIFAVSPTFTYVYRKDDKDPVILLKYTFIVDYHVKNLLEIFSVENERDFNIDETWEKNFVGLAISTGRGLLYNKCLGTFFGNFIFPVIDPSQVILSKNLKKI